FAPRDQAGRADQETPTGKEAAMQRPSVSQHPSDPRPARTMARPERLLVPRRAGGEAPQYHHVQRHSITPQGLEPRLGAAAAPARVLAVACNVLNLLPRFLDPRRYRVRRCDVRPFASDADFLFIDEKRQLPFADSAFDAVVALEVLEHLPAERRLGFLSECLRVARHGAVFTCPNGVPEVVEAERLAAAVYQQGHVEPHPFLREHQEFGLPSEQEVVALLREFDYPTPSST